MAVELRQVLSSYPRMRRTIGWLVGQVNEINNGGAGTSGWAEVGTGTPANTTTEDITRTGKIGLGEATPAELLDVVGTEAGASGAVKFDYTYASGAVSRVQFGGQNVLSEIGVSAGLVEANLFDFFGVGTQSDLRAYLYNGNVDAVSAAAGNISIGVGVQALSTTANANFTVFPNDNGTSPDMVARIINSHPTTGYSYITAYQVATSTPYTTEPAVENRIYDLVNTKIGNYYWTAHWADYNEGLKMDMLGSGTLIPGYTFGNTAATVIGAVAKGVGVDADGQFLAIASPVQTIKVSLTALQLKTLSSAPVEVLPAPGVGKTIFPLGAAGRSTWGSVAFDTQYIYVFVGGHAFNDQQFILPATSNVVGIRFASGDDFSFNTNTAMTITSDADSVATGDSTAEIWITYQIVDD